MKRILTLCWLVLCGLCLVPATGALSIPATRTAPPCSSNPPIPSGPRIHEDLSFERSPTEIETKIRQTLKESDRDLQRLLQASVTPCLSDSLETLDQLKARVQELEARYDFLQDAGASPKLREAAAAASQALQNYQLQTFQLNARLYAWLLKQADSRAEANLSPSHQRLWQLTKAGFENEGLRLANSKQHVLKEKEERLARLTNLARRHIAKDRGLIELSHEALKGLPSEQLALLPHPRPGVCSIAAADDALYHQLMRTLESASTRQALLKTRYQRAMQSNGQNLLEILRLRLEIAHLLGYKNWLSLRLQSSVVGDEEHAFHFLNELEARLHETREQEKLSLASFTHGQPLVLGNIERALFLSQEYREHETDEKMPLLFRESTVLPRFLDLVGELFDISFTPRPKLNSWTQELVSYQLFDRKSAQPLGLLYLDLHPRPGKVQGFAEYTLREGRLDRKGGYRAPISVVLGNIPGSASNATWTLEDVQTFAHEFGHALHTLLRDSPFYGFSKAQLPMDFVELPAQFFTAWVIQPDVLLSLQASESEPKSPTEYVQRTLIRRDIAPAHTLQRQLAFALADLHLHAYQKATELPQTPPALFTVSNRELSRYYPVPDGTGLIASFEHLFKGYDALYYSYLWADVVAADILAHFAPAPKGLRDPEMGLRLRHKLFAPGAQEEPSQMLQEFLGRPPNPDAFFEALSKHPMVHSLQDKTQ